MKVKLYKKLAYDDVAIGSGVGIEYKVSIWHEDEVDDELMGWMMEIGEHFEAVTADGDIFLECIDCDGYEREVIEDIEKELGKDLADKYRDAISKIRELKEKGYYLIVTL